MVANMQYRCLSDFLNYTGFLERALMYMFKRELKKLIYKNTNKHLSNHSKFSTLKPTIESYPSWLLCYCQQNTSCMFLLTNRWDKINMIANISKIIDSSVQTTGC